MLGVSSFLNFVFSSSVWLSGIKLRPFKFIPKRGENKAVYALFYYAIIFYLSVRTSVHRFK